MKYISAKEFLSQPKEVQQVFKRWWKPEMYDLFFRDFGNNKNAFVNGIYESCIQDCETQNNATKDSAFLPLLTEGQLRQFIEGKTNTKVLTEFTFGTENYSILCFSNSNNIKYFVDELGDDLLQALWQVACRIATK